MAAPLRRYYEGLFLLLLASGFATLATTGKLGWAVALIAGSAYGLRAGLFWRQRELRISPRWLPAGLLAYLPVFALDGFFLSHSFLLASLHLVALAGAVQLFTVRGGRDHLALGLLALLEVLAAALLTVSGTFFLLFLVFLVLMISTLVAHEMLRSSTARAKPASGAQPSSADSGRIATVEEDSDLTATPRGLLPKLLRFSLLLSLGVVICSVVIFFLLPRTTMGAWASQPLTGMSGFNDEVQLGEIARLQRSNRPVMHIRLTKSDPAVTPEMFEQIPWRGRGLTYFDGQTWSSPGGASIYNTNAGQLEVSRPSWRLPPEVIHYEVTLEPIGSPVLFFPPRLLRTTTHFSMLAWERSTATLSSVGSNFAGVSYAGESDLSQPSPAELRQSPPIDSERMRDAMAPFLQLPSSLDPRIRDLAQAIVANSPPDNWDRMQALTRYLQTHYQYSLDHLPQGPAPLATFLFDQPDGDCEYFASALAVMARTLGIPTRLVNGFVLGSYNPLTGEYLVRGSDAHSWVEAYFPPSGVNRWAEHGNWITFDATPPAIAATSLWPQAGMMMDALSSFWQDWFVSYDWIHQANLIRGLQGMVQGATGRVWQASLSGVRAEARGRNPAAKAGLAALAAIFLLLLGITAVARRRGWSWQTRKQTPARSGEHARLAYRRFQRQLRRFGIPHSPAQTAPELLAAVVAAQPGTALVNAAGEFVGIYDALRFGQPRDARSAAVLLARLDQALVQVRRTRPASSLIGAGPRSATPSDPLTLDRPGTPESPSRSGPRLFSFRGRTALRNSAASPRRFCPPCIRRGPRVR